ncbi:MAG TPA: DUF4838 domain-containing protein, partial [Opitutales bacterium]|nr:DUF4838 domain-containing protein [Opitutales bacterium]
STGFDIQSTAQGAQNAAQGLSQLAEGKVVIVLGTTVAKPDPRLAALADDGFLIHRENNVINISGHTGNGTYFGAVSFLGRYAGVRFYMPTELWTSLPANHTVVFDGDDVVSNPFVVSGEITGLTGKDWGDPDWAKRIGALRRKGGVHQHNLYSIFPPEEFATTHPEIYPILDGKRYIPANAGDQGWQIDFAEPETLIAAEQSITEYFQKNPTLEYIAVSINDSNRWSQSQRYLDAIAAFKAKEPKGDFQGDAVSDIYWRFMNQLAVWMKQKFPDKLLLGLAYNSTMNVPSFPLEENILVFTVMHLSEFPGYTASTNGQLSVLDTWLAKAHHFGQHEWYEGNGYAMPRIYSGYWSQFMRALAKHYSSAYMHAEGYPNWGYDGPKFYILTQMWWNPQADPVALTRQFCNDMFGPAAKPMADYFTHAEALWTQLDDNEGPKRKIGIWYNQFNTTPTSRQMIQHCHDDLQLAAAAAQTDDEKQRVALFAKCFAFSESVFQLAAKPTDETLYATAVAQAQELAKDKFAIYDPVQLTDAIQAYHKDPVKK